MKKILSIVFTAIMLPVLSMAADVVEYDKDGKIKKVVGSSGNIEVTLQNITTAGLGSIGAICVGVLIYGGFLWALASGSQEKIGKAKNIIIYSSVGLAVTFGAYAIALAVFNLI